MNIAIARSSEIIPYSLLSCIALLLLRNLASWMPNQLGHFSKRKSPAQVITDHRMPTLPLVQCNLVLEGTYEQLCYNVKILSSVLRPSGLRVHSEQYPMYCDTIRSGIIVRITLGTVIVFPEESYKCFCPKGRSCTRCGLVMNPSK